MHSEPHIILVEKQPLLARFKPNNFFNTLTTTVQSIAGGNLVNATKSSLGIVKYETNSGHRAYELIFNALGAAAVGLLNKGHRKVIEGNLVNKKGLLDLKLNKEIEELELEVTPVFFAAPKDFELIKVVRPIYKEWLVFLGLSEEIAEQLQRKLSHQFLLELTKEWADKSEHYQLILDKFKTPFYEAWKKEYYTRQYQDELKELINEPAMGDELLPLAKIYIKPYFTIHERCCGDNLGERNKDGFIERIPFNQTIHDYIEQRIIYNKQPLGLEVEKSNLIFLLGQPGQGKSSFCLYTLNSLLEHPDFDKKIYFLRLKDIINTRELINHPFDSIKDYIKENNHLDFSDDNSVLILDGLDEIYQREGLSDKEVEKFYDKLDQESENKKNLTVILTSRYNYLNISAISKKTTTILKLKGLRLEQQQRWLSIYKTVHQDCTLSLDKLKEISKNPRLKHIKELIEQPILLHIVTTAKIDIDDKLNRSVIYENLFDALIKRSWDKKKGQLKKYENLEDYQYEFREWLQEIAFNIYRSDFEYIQRQALLDLKTTKTIKSKLITSHDFKDAQKDLLVAFYFKNTKVNKKDISIDAREEYAIEFLHKSLQEYLTAEHIWNTIQDEILHKKRGRFYIDNFEDTLGLFFNLFAHKEINESIRSLLIQMVENAPKKNKQELGNRLELFLSDCMNHQFLYKYDSSSSSSIEHLGNPFNKALNTFYGYWLILSHLGLNKNLLPIEHRQNFVHLIRKASLPINLNKINLAGANLIRAYLKDADLSGAHLEGADLRRAILKGVNLKKAYLQYANLKNVHLNRADLRKADLREADLRKADLREADLRKADLREADLREADFGGAYLRKADLRGADLRETDQMLVHIKARLALNNLIAIKLRELNPIEATEPIETDLSLANLRRVNLQMADLSLSYLSRAKVSNTNFIEQLAKWNCIGIQEIKNKYYIDPQEHYDKEDKNKEYPYYIIKEKQTKSQNRE